MATKKSIATDKQVSAAKPGKHGLGGNLYLFVSLTGSRSWVFRYMHDGKAREMGLGSYPLVGLAEARRRAEEARGSKARREDPLNRVSYSQRDGWQWCGIAHETYGYAYIPKASAGTMKRVDGEEVPADLASTHILVDVLGTKHGLMEQLGLGAAIDYDKRQIGNSLRLEEEARR